MAESSRQEEDRSFEINMPKFSFGFYTDKHLAAITGLYFVHVNSTRKKKVIQSVNFINIKVKIDIFHKSYSSWCINSLGTEINNCNK